MFLWQAIAGAAALLLIFFALWFFKPQSVSDNQDSNARINKKESTDLRDRKNDLIIDDDDKSDLKSGGTKITNKNKTLPKRDFKDHIKPLENSLEYAISPNNLNLFAQSIKQVNTGKLNQNPLLNFTDFKINSDSGETISTKSKQLAITSNYRRLSFSITLSPDLNSAENFNNSKIGESFGLGASYQASKKLSINSGFYYSKKTYSADPLKYKSDLEPFNYSKYAQSIDADCRVIDLPVNLSYKMLEKSGHTISVSTGLSSYFMLREKYTFIRKANPSYPPTGPEPSYTIDNKNQHIFSVINLSAGFTKPLNSKLDLTIEPYAKLPVSGIGQGKVNLQSVGLAFQLDFKPIKKKVKSNK